MGRAGRGGGGFRGGRSGGFSGGGRRSGGFSGGGRSGRSSGSSWGGSRGSGGFFFAPTRNRTVIVTGGGGGGYRGGSRGTTLLSVLMVIFMLIIIFSFVSAAFNGSGSSSVAPSTVEREPLPAGSVNETGYYTDELGWIVDSGALTKGMKAFYQETGIQPYLYITDSVDGSHDISVQALSDYSAKLYDQMFTDEAHFLVVFCEYDSEYHVGYTMGAQAKSVLDDEALGIFRDYLDRYYYEDISEEEFFSRTFADTGERIMTITKSPWPVVLLVFGLVLLVAVLFFWWKKRKEQEALEHKRTEELLNTPIETFGDTEAEKLAKKYQQNEETSQAQGTDSVGAGESKE